jgi:hypothetical protein
MSAVLLSDAKPKARKAHKCGLCYRQIEQGETYRRQTVRGDYGIETWTICAHCDALNDWLWFNDKDARWCLQDGEFDMAEWISEYYRDSPATHLFRAGWRERGELVPLSAVVPVDVNEEGTR